MLIVGPQGDLIEVPVFQAAVIDFFSKIGAGAFQTRVIEGMGKAPAYTAVVTLPGAWEIAAGRSVDEACVRLVARVAERLSCPQCNRPVVMDEQVISPMTIEARDYLRLDQSDLPVCTIYFDHRDAAFKRACDGFDTSIEPIFDLSGK